MRSGRRLAGRLERLSVERHLRDLEEGPKRGLHFDERAALRFLRFCRLCRHSRGRKWAGKPFIPEPAQAFRFWVVFGWKRADGRRRFTSVYTEIGKKNGKSAEAAVVALYLLVADGEPGAHVYSAATKKDQARIVHGEAASMVRKSPALSKFVGRTGGRVAQSLWVLQTESKFEPLSADDDTMDGLDVHGALIDELHAHKTSAVVDQLETATAAREQPLVWMLTTAGYDRETVCWRKREYSVQVLEGSYTDSSADATAAFIYTLDEGDDWRDEKVWGKSNPNLGVTIPLEKLREQAQQAQAQPLFENAFKRFRLNIWTQQSTRWLQLEAWDKCAGGRGPVPPPILAKELVGRACWGALDLSSTDDITALAWAFPDPEVADTFDLLIRCWIPEERMRARVKRDKVPYDVWVREGWITATPGDVIDYSFVKAAVLEDAKVFDVRELAYDKWNMGRLEQELTDEGLTMVQFTQNLASFNYPTKDLATKVHQGRIRHHGNPVLRWAAGNLVVKQDASANIRPDKAKSSEKIDPIVAAIMALGRATLQGGDTGPSIYESRGLYDAGDED